MTDPILNSGLILLVHPVEISQHCIIKHIIAAKSWSSVLELDVNLLMKDAIQCLTIPQCQVVFVDLTKFIYLNNYEKYIIISTLRKIESVVQKRQLPVFAFIRDDLLSNDYFYSVSRAMIISGNENDSSFEERFTECHESYTVSVLTKPGSGKIELDDRFEFSATDGFKSKRQRSSNCNEIESAKVPVSTFNLGSKKSETTSSDARIVVEDSDRDSEDEMEADSNF